VSANSPTILRVPTHRLIIDDPDGFSNEYEAGQQQHGTAMASLIVHGDLSASGEACSRPVYARPVMYPVVENASVTRETFPPNRLFVDSFYRATLRMIEGEVSFPKDC
jgi:hypothetical protein